MERAEEQVTEWNQAKAFQIRIDRLLRSAHVAALNSDYTTWFKCIHGFYRELSSVIEDDSEEREVREMIIDVRNHLRNEENEAKLFDVFSKVETLLRKKMNKKGLLIPKRKDPRGAMYD